MADNFKQLRCPACQKPMTKVFVPKEGVNVDICLDGCGGMYFDNRELTYFDEQSEGIDNILEAIQGKTFEPVDQNNFRSCPVCGARMVKNFTSDKRHITIDECYSCGGKFLDAGELVSMRAEYDTESARREAVLKQIDSTVGNEIREMEFQHANAMQHRSVFRKLFDAIVDNSMTNY